MLILDCKVTVLSAEWMINSSKLSIIWLNSDIIIKFQDDSYSRERHSVQ